MLNQLVGGHYKIIRNLGAGGLSKTYIAEDLHRPGHPKCAVKLLKPKDKDPNFLPEARRLFHQEAEILEKLGQHDQIPRLLAYFEENQEFYLVQELIYGKTLTRELKTGSRWTESQVIQMLQDVLPILEFVHSNKVIHRDIKPHNLIRRNQDGRLVLIDFGAVKQISSPNMMNNKALIQTTICIGTQGYIPMEQLRGKPRFNSDIYALGITCIQALTGVLPRDLDLREDKDGEIIWRDLVEVSDELAHILSKMVRCYFQKRYQSATEVLQDLQTLAHDNSLRLMPVNSNNRQATPKATSGQGKWKSLVFPVNLLKPSANLLPSSTPMVPPNKLLLRFGAGMMSLLVTVLAGYTYISNKHDYLKAQEALEEIEKLKKAKKYQECRQQAQAFPPNYSQLDLQAQLLKSDCQEEEVKKQLAEARKLAQQSSFQDAIVLAAQVPEDSNFYLEAQELISLWSEEMFQIASNKYQEGNFQEAVAIARAIPTFSPLAPKIENTIQQWNQEWQKNQTHLQTAQKAMDEGRWQDAINTAKKISNTTYWQEQSEQIIQKAKAEIASAQVAASRKRYQSRSGRSRSVSSSRGSVRRSRSRSNSSTKPSSNSTKSNKSNSISIKSRSISINPSATSSQSGSTSTSSRSDEWKCLNNPNPKCRR